MNDSNIYEITTGKNILGMKPSEVSNNLQKQFWDTELKKIKLQEHIKRMSVK